MTPGGSLDLGATAGLLVVAVALAALAAWLMSIRDIGSPLLRRRRREHEMTQLPSRNRLLRQPVLASLYERRFGLLAWTVGATIGALYSGTIGRSMANLAKGGGSYLSAAANSVALHAGDLIVASLALLPFVLSFAAIGAVLTSRIPRATIAVLATLAFLSYLITEGGPLLKWPDWVMKLSAFSLYGTPLTSGVYWSGLWILLAVTVVGFGVAAALMQRREVGR